MRTLLTVAQLSERSPGLTQPALRWILFKADQNGLAKSGAVIRNGRRVLIDVERFFDWLDSRQETAPLSPSASATPVIAAHNRGE